MKRQAFCLNCGHVGTAEVPEPDPVRAPGVPLDGTPVPGWCGAADCRGAQRQFNETCERITRELSL